MRPRGASGPALALGVVLTCAPSIPSVRGAEDRIRLTPPLPVDLPVTASFGEYRRGHLHAGLDFSTGGELGWPVRAAAAGEIFRLKVEKRGYGRAVYIRHPGGFVTVYGHLHRFENDELGLEKKVQEEVDGSKNRYPGDIYLNPRVPVRERQVIGLSGENGGGPAHLHFELRKEDEPVDPARYGGLEPRGFARPILDALWILPRGATRIDGNWGAERYSFVNERGTYRLAELPEIEGRFDLELEAHVPGAGTMGLSLLELVCGPRRLFRADLHRFSFAQYGQSGLVYDPARSGTGPTRFTYRLRAPAGLDLPGVEGAWLKDPEEGRLDCILTASDALGNTVTGEMLLDVLPSPGYARQLPSTVASHEMHSRLLVLNGDVPLDPANLPDGAAEGMPQVAIPGREEVVVRPRPDLEIRFPAGAAYGLTAISIAPDRSVPRPEDGLEEVVPPVRIGPANLFLRKEALWLARAPDPARSALYRYDTGKERWSVVGKEMLPGAVQQGSRHGGTFAVFRDTAAPIILAVQLRDEERLGARRMVFPTTDVGEGIDVEAFEVAIDGKPVPAEYDPDRGWGQVWLRQSWRGGHSVSAICQDRAGNKSARFDATVTF